jgi:hypothetical protein
MCHAILCVDTSYYIEVLAKYPSLLEECGFCNTVDVAPYTRREVFSNPINIVKNIT